MSNVKTSAFGSLLEVLLFASLVFAVVWCQFTQPWPSVADVRIEWWRGLLSTLVMVASAWTMTQARRTAADRNCAARWLGWTLGLGVLFVALQLNELRTRYRDGLMPVIGAGVHDRADLHYLSAVHRRLHGLASELNAAAIQQNVASGNGESRSVGMSESRAERLAIVNQLIASELAWTESRVAASSDVEYQRAAMASLAYDVFPSASFAEVHREFSERVRVEEARRAEAAKGAMQTAAEQVKLHSPELKKQLVVVSDLKAGLQSAKDARRKFPPEFDDEVPAEVNELDERIESLQDEFDEANDELSRLASAVTVAEDQLAQLRIELAAINARQTLRKSFEDGSEDKRRSGLNERYVWLRLPVAVPGGRVWAWAYVVLVAMHVAFVLVGLFNIVPRLARCDQPLGLVGLSRYWYVQVAAACAIAAVFYIR